MLFCYYEGSPGLLARCRVLGTYRFALAISLQTDSTDPRVPGSGTPSPWALQRFVDSSLRGGRNMEAAIACWHSIDLPVEQMFEEREVLCDRKPEPRIQRQVFVVTSNKNPKVNKKNLGAWKVRLHKWSKLDVALQPMTILAPSLSLQCPLSLTFLAILSLPAQPPPIQIILSTSLAISRQLFNS